MTIIAFTDLCGTGKSTAANLLVNRGFTDVKFADPLKNMLRAMWATCGVSPADAERRLEGDLKELPDPWLDGQTPRHAMQTLGTEWRDMISTDLWSKMFHARVIALGDADIVCSDFAHEEVVLRSFGAKLIRVTNDRIQNDGYSDHVSESTSASLGVDYKLENNGSKYELGRNLECILDEIRG